MIGYFTPTSQGTGDDLIIAAADHFEQKGLRLAGAVQFNFLSQNSKRARMAVKVFGEEQHVGISQNLGPYSTGCALDPEGLETAAELVSRSLNSSHDLLILNKFGKQERDGQGFRDVLVKALDQDIPVLLGVNLTLEEAFQNFAGEFAIKLNADLNAIDAWFESTQR